MSDPHDQIPDPAQHLRAASLPDATRERIRQLTAAATRRQVEMGQHATETVAMLLAASNAVLTAEDHDGVAEARGRLLALNPERETLSGLLKAASETGE